jgi:hypothetical protein
VATSLAAPLNSIALVAAVAGRPGVPVGTLVVA